MMTVTVKMMMTVVMTITVTFNSPQIFAENALIVTMMTRRRRRSWDKDDDIDKNYDFATRYSECCNMFNIPGRHTDNVQTV